MRRGRSQGGEHAGVNAYVAVVEFGVKDLGVGVVNVLRVEGDELAVSCGAGQSILFASGV